MSASAPASVLLTIDISNPEAVVISSTGAAPLVNEELSYYSGLSLMGFFISEFQINLDIEALETDLMPAGVTVPLNFSFIFSYSSGDYSSGGSDLNFYSDSEQANDEVQNYNTSFSAFSGQMTVDYTGIFYFLPSVGASGDVRTGDGFEGAEGSVIGTYLVIPEPSSALLVLSGAIFLLRRRR